MKVKDVMTPEPYTCRTSDPVDLPCRLMWNHDCGFVPVVDERGQVVGVVTDRDIAMASWSRGVSMDRIRVGNAMTAEVVTVRADDELLTAHDAMRAHRIRRLPVVDEAGRLQGVLSINDLARFADQQRGAAQSAGYTETSVTLAAICGARVHPRAA